MDPSKSVTSFMNHAKEHNSSITSNFLYSNDTVEQIAISALSSEDLILRVFSCFLFSESRLELMNSDMLPFNRISISTTIYLSIYLISLFITLLITFDKS